MTVVDASIVVRLLLRGAHDDALRERFSRERRAHAPTVIDAEVVSAVRGLLMASSTASKLSPMRAGEMLDDYSSLPLVLHPMQPLQRRVLALRNNFTAYDALYVALSEFLDMPLLTDDRKFAGAPGHTASIETWG